MTAPPSPEELLSAYLDDELAPDERAEVERWLAEDPARRVELDGLAAVRHQVRGLPWLELPAELRPAVSALSGRRTRRRGAGRRASDVVAVLGATIAVVVLAGALVLGGGRPAEASPVPVHEAVAIHRQGTWPVPPSSSHDLTAPPAVDGYRVVGLVRVEDGDLTGMHYTDGSRSFSVFERRGRVKWSSLGAGEWGEIDGDRTWAGRIDGYDVLVLQRPGRVYVVIGDDRSYARQVSSEMPGEGEPSLWRRVTRRCHDTLHLFSGR